MTQPPGMADFVRQTLLDRMVRQREPLEIAASVMRQMGLDQQVLDQVVHELQELIDENNILDSPTGVVDRSMESNAQMMAWYSGPDSSDLHWPRLKERLLGSRMASVVPDIDQASTKVVAQLANPAVHKLKKRGLVLGYVQSGKTANFTAVMAKAADRGVGLFIVLSGIHNNLRQQTQVRIAKDLTFESGDWVALTTPDADFVNDSRHSGASQLRPDRPVVIVVKKNPSRLQSLRDWLRDTPMEIRQRTPVLVIDDEADQATPNGASGKQQRSAINALVREVWESIPTGTYVGYTATPFANIFMDPDDEQDLYPANFIIDLPRPVDYFGAEAIFGREALDEDDEADSGHDVVRAISDEDGALLRPPSKKEDRLDWNATVPASLREALVWFLVATAIRRARGHDDHSSMLVHTTHFADPHFAMQRVIAKLIAELEEAWGRGDLTAFEHSFRREATRAQSAATEPLPSWSGVRDEIKRVLDDARVIVDNGSSTDRLDYGRKDEHGQPISEVAVAIGGGTLSRGLTLEGLVVSYFTRTSNTYDTLLQMGRWFGYRPGYEDLPRIWVQPSLADEYRFLALVEAEIRRDILEMERQQVTPRELGVRVRAHPGRLAIVAKNKMGAADLVRVSFSGERLQTFILDKSAGVARKNLEATRRFLAKCAASRDVAATTRPPRWRISDVGSSAVSEFLREFSFHGDLTSMNSEYMAGWIDEVATESDWNVTVMGSGRIGRDARGAVVDLGSADLGLGAPVPAINRAPLQSSVPGAANIKALLNHADWFADLDSSAVAALGKDAERFPREVRRQLANGNGQVILYVVSKDSVPATEASELSRSAMDAPEHLVGLGLIFPEVSDSPGDATYYSVKPNWQVMAEEEDEIPEDTEGDATFDDAEGVAE